MITTCLLNKGEKKEKKKRTTNIIRQRGGSSFFFTWFLNINFYYTILKKSIYKIMMSVQCVSNDVRLFFNKKRKQRDHEFLSIVYITLYYYITDCQ